MAELKNPFDLVKATDLTDDQIADYFVDFPGGASLLDRIKPTSKMPMFIFGGKGSGKTHLMRYLAYPLQIHRLGRGASERAGIANEGYLGIYFNCSGLNAQRFSGKGQSDEVWQAVFGYYMELWFAQLVLVTIEDLYNDSPSINGPQLLTDATRLLDIPPAQPPTTLGDLARYFETLQRQADVVINNSALTGELDIQIRAAPGRLVFGLPQALVRHLPELRSVLFLYLIDEFENLPEEQQRYINTIVRERQEPCSFKVGVRLYGFRTKQTLSREENREDSEYEAFRLDTELRQRPNDAQLKFATDLVRKRLVEAGYVTEHRDLTAWFETTKRVSLLHMDVGDAKNRYRDGEPQYVVTLRNKLEQGLRAAVTPGLCTATDIQHVITTLRYPEYPLVERTSIFLLYRAWARRRNLIETADTLSRDSHRFVDGDKSTGHYKVLRYFRSDVEAQLLRETKQKQRYLGFGSFVKMSSGLPRCLLTILKYIFTWSLFYGEKPFREDQKISVHTQTDGVTQASEWFFTEARAPGSAGALVRDAMTRLGQVMREIRFSDKPSECSLSTFSTDLTTASKAAIAVIKEAENWSMLVRVQGGQHDRNVGRVDEKYQIHPMLAPRWDLPIARRGALAFSGDETSAIFAPSAPADFETVLKRRVAAMTAPFFGTAPKRKISHSRDLFDG